MSEYCNSITSSDTIMFALKQCNGNVINEVECREAIEHYKRLEASNKELLEALQDMVDIHDNLSDLQPGHWKAVREAIAKAKGE